MDVMDDAFYVESHCWMPLLMELPLVGYGTYQLNNVTENVQHAIQTGYKNIDTASFYNNEKDIAPAIAPVRKSLFITSKLWPTDFDCVEEACQTSLDNLGIEQLICIWSTGHLHSRKERLRPRMWIWYSCGRKWNCWFKKAWQDTLVSAISM